MKDYTDYLREGFRAGFCQSCHEKHDCRFLTKEWFFCGCQLRAIETEDYMIKMKEVQRGPIK
jgi:hypothetical protein